MNAPTQAMNDSQLDQVLFDQARNMDADKEYWFQLRGDNINQLIDAAAPLFGMVLRVQKLAQLDEVEKLYHNCVDDIMAIESELAQSGRERAVILAYRYILCTFVDEAVMNTAWGAESIWAEHSLLTRFHNETWGGEKVYGILQRLEAEPKNYVELLEFIYLCFCLGFEGRYKVLANGREEFDKILNRLYETLRQLRDEEPNLIVSASDNVVSTRYRIGKQIPLWTIFAGFAVIWCGIFVLYSVMLSGRSTSVLDQLLQILN